MSRTVVRSKATPLRIRQYLPKDHRRVVRLWRDSGLGISHSDTVREIERTRRRDPDLFLVAEEEGVLVGVVLGRFDGRRGWVNHLAIDRRARGLGLGVALMAELERRLVRKGCPKINLQVEPANEAVTGFYERLGYRRRPMIFMERWMRGAPRRPPTPRPRARPSAGKRRPRRVRTD